MSNYELGIIGLTVINEAFGRFVVCGPGPIYFSVAFQNALLHVAEHDCELVAC